MKLDMNKKRIIIAVVVVVLILSYAYLCFYNFKILDEYDNLILPNTYIGNYDVSYFSYDYCDRKLDDYSEELLAKTVKFSVNSKDVEYSLKDLGVSINKKKIINRIKKYQNGLSNSRKLIVVNRKIKNQFDIVYKFDDNKIKEAMERIKNENDVNGYNGYFDTSDGVKYIKGANSFYLNVDKSVDIVKNAFSNGVDVKDSITLDGEVIPFDNNESYESINTLTSSYSTVFTPNTYLRNINLNTALSYINGTVVEPGGIFSYCNTAGPFNKQGYVFYYEFVGNGVCQIATTTYNAALRGGLEIVKRYPHAKRSAYVPGGLDATVASYASGWCVDMQFKNTYEYPIYIKAYSAGGVAYVEFWSNSEAKHGRTYEATSVRIGNIGYRSYLHTYENGEEIDVHEIETTWYKEE